MTTESPAYNSMRLIEDLEDGQLVFYWTRFNGKTLYTSQGFDTRLAAMQAKEDGKLRWEEA